MHRKEEEQEREGEGGDLADSDVVRGVVGRVSLGGLPGWRVALRVPVGSVIVLIFSLPSPRHSLPCCFSFFRLRRSHSFFYSSLSLQREEE